MTRNALASMWLMLGLAVAAPASAHHSQGMFDASKKVNLTGTVKEFQWTNPHVWLQLMVADDKGEVHEWSLEGATPVMLNRRGWRSSSLTPGETVTVVSNPLRSGAYGGTLGLVTRANGETVGDRTGGD